MPTISSKPVISLSFLRIKKLLLNQNKKQKAGKGKKVFRQALFLKKGLQGYGDSVPAVESEV
jgi:hypothetical protein